MSIVDMYRLRQYAEQGKLRHAVHRDRDLHIWCYSYVTVFTRDWDDLTLMCRGLVTTGDGTVVSMPFPKFFNWGEPLAPGPEIVTLPFWGYDKMDGTLIIVGTDANGDVVVSTKGSFSTWHSEVAAKMLDGWTPQPNVTAIFELIHPDNRFLGPGRVRHILDYGDTEELVLLGAVSNEDRCDHFRPEDYAEESGWHGRVVPPQSFRLQQILQTIQNPENGLNREGFVVVWPNSEGPSHRVKLKFAQYMYLHGVLDRLSDVAVWEALSTGTFDALLEVVPDEFYDRVRQCADELNSEFTALKTLAIDVAHTARLLHDTRAGQAQYILGKFDTINSGLVFRALDDKGLDKAVWAQIKPERDGHETGGTGVYSGGRLWGDVHAIHAQP